MVVRADAGIVFVGNQFSMTVAVSEQELHSRDTLNSPKILPFISRNVWSLALIVHDVRAHKLPTPDIRNHRRPRSYPRIPPQHGDCSDCPAAAFREIAHEI